MLRILLLSIQLLNKHDIVLCCSVKVLLAFACYLYTLPLLISLDPVSMALIPHIVSKCLELAHCNTE